MRTLERVAAWLARWLAWAGGVALLLMMLQTVLDLLMARAFGRPIEGNQEIVSVYHMVLVVFLPLAMVELRHEHISADLFVRLLPRRLQRAAYVLGCVISLGFFGILCYQTGVDALTSFRIDEVMMSSIYIPLWPAKFALPIGFVAMLLVIVVNMLKALTDPTFDPAPAAPLADEAEALQCPEHRTAP